MMVYNTQNYWLYGLRPSSGILKTRIPDNGQSPKTSNSEWYYLMYKPIRYLDSCFYVDKPDQMAYVGSHDYMIYQFCIKQSLEFIVLCDCNKGSHMYWCKSWYVYHYGVQWCRLHWMWGCFKRNIVVLNDYSAGIGTLSWIGYHDT
jgi:hypothetical protein